MVLVTKYSLALLKGTHAVAPRNGQQRGFAGCVAHHVVGQVHVIELLVRELRAELLEHGPQGAAGPGQLVGPPIEIGGVRARAVLRHHVIGEGVAQAAVAAAFRQGDALGFGIPGHILDDRAQDAMIGDVPRAIGLLRLEEHDIGLDHHPGARLDLGLQAAGGGLAVPDGLPHHVAHQLVIERVVRGDRLGEARVGRMHQAHVGFFRGHAAKRQRGGGLGGGQNEIAAGETHGLDSTFQFNYIRVRVPAKAGWADDRFWSSVGEGLRPAEFHEIPGAMWGRLAGRQPAGRLAIGPRGD